MIKNEELIDVFRKVERADYPICCKCPITSACDDVGERCLFGSATDVLEAFEERIAELEAQLLKIKSQIYNLESMAKCEYDDDSDNEYLEGYFDGLHHAAKLISTTSTTEER